MFPSSVSSPVEQPLRKEHLFFQGLPAAARLRAVSSPPRPMVREMQETPHGGAFLDRLFDMAGLTAQPYRGAALQRRLKASLRVLGVEDPAAALRRLEKNPALVAPALDAVLLGVTEFFRDGPVFEVLERRVLPALLAGGFPLSGEGPDGPAGKRESGGAGEMPVRPALRIWSAACSDGRELCSVAMLLEEAGALENSTLLGTDCRAEAVRHAGQGGFPAAVLESLSVERRERHFTAGAGGMFHLSDRLRRVLRWRAADLFRETAAGPWDMILWRNMAIYLQPSAAETLWHQLYRELRPGGCLITGRAEQPPRDLPLARLAPCIYRKPDGVYEV